MSQNTLFNECRACKMKFDSRAQLENHVKKFCVESEYGTQDKLEQKYQFELKNKYQKSNINQDNNQISQLQQLNQNPYVGQSLESLQFKVTKGEEDYRRQIQQQQNKNDRVMQDQLEIIQDERKNIRLKKDDDEKAFKELLYELELKKEKEIRARVEKDQIRRAMVELEKNKLTTIEQEKKKELERLVQERESLRLKENELLQDIQEVETNTKLLDQIRKEEFDRINGVVDGLKLKQTTNKNLNEQLIVERADRVAALKLKREQLEGERMRIMNDLQSVRNGEIPNKRTGQMNLVTNAKNILNDMRDLAGYGIDNKNNINNNINNNYNNNNNNINNNNNNSRIGKQLLPFDPDEAFQNKISAPQYANVQYEDNLKQLNDTKGLEQLQGFRKGLERHNQSLNLNDVTAQKILMERSQMMSRRGQSIVNNQQFIPQNQMNSNKTQNQSFVQNQIQNANDLNKTNYNNQLMNAWGVSVPQYQNNQFQILGVPQYQQQQQQQNQMQQQTQPAILGQFALNQMAPNANGKVIDPWDLFSRKNEFFLQNEVRGVDLSEEERTLVSLNAQEIDAMRILSRIPVGTELYRFKVEQYKELSQLRSEIEKIVQEQRLQDAKRDFEMERREEDRIYENEKWVDNHKRQILENRMRKDNTKKLGLNQNNGNQYNTGNGFVIHWDYALGLPRRTNYSQIIFGLYNGQQEIQIPRLVDPRETETSSINYNRCIFGDSNQIYEVPVHQDIIMIIELQIPFSKRVEDNLGRTETYGWTQLDLFDHNQQLKRGKFKCPVYYGPTDPTITIEEIQNLEPIPDCFIYLRVSLPGDNDINQVKSIYPEQTMHEYQVPYIHLRGLFGKRQSIQQKQQGYEDEGYIIREELKQNQPNQTVQIIQQQQKEPSINQTIEQPPPLQQFQYEPEVVEVSVMGKKKGLRIIVYRIINHQARSHLRVQGALLEDGNLVLDDNGLPVAFNTTVHNPLDNRVEMRLNIPETFIIPLTTQNPEYNGMNNKSKGGDIIIQEEYRVFRNLYSMWKNNKKDLWIGLQVMEKPEPVEMQSQNLDSSKNFGGGLEFDLVSWYFLKITDFKGDILTGKFNMKMNLPPLRKPPIDPNKVKESALSIEFALHQFEYDEAELQEYRIQMKKRLMPKPPPPKPVTPDDVKLNNNPYIENLKPQWTNKPFERRMGIDFYIDGLRFLPDKVTVCQIYMEVYNSQFEKIFEAEATLPELNSMSYMPQFHYRRELRKDHFDPTCVALMTIVSIDKSINQNRIVGYAGINLFLNPYTKLQPSNPNDQEVVLMNGSYQIAVLSVQIDRTPPFSIQKIYSHERSPCCSMLIRINQAPLSEDNKRALSIMDFPDIKKQIEKGLMLPKQPYGREVYNTQLCPMNESEKELLTHRVIRNDITVRESANLLIQGDQINKELKDKEIYKYLETKLFLTNDTKMIDMLYFSKYRPQAGFKFVIDGLHNVNPISNAHIVLYSLSLPGTFYLEPHDVTQAHMTSTYDWESVAKSPQYSDEWFIFKENMNRYLNIIIDVKTVPFKKFDSKITDLGWTILPVFSPDGYVMSNIYQLPLFRGAIPKQIIEGIKKQDAWEFLAQQIKDKRIFYTENISVICRLVDSQRDGHFSKRFDCNRLNYKYLPQDTIKKWSYNSAVEIGQQNEPKVKSQITNKDNPTTFNRKITDYFANSYALRQYLSS